MKRILFFITVLSVFQLGAQNLNYLEGEVLVQLKENSTPKQLLENNSNLTFINTKLISRPLNIWRIWFDSSDLNENRMITILHNDSEVLVAQKNRKVSERATIPNDPLFDNQWQYYQANDKDIDADEAWDVTTGGTTPNGDVIVVGVIDGGCNLNHPDLIDNLWVNEEEIPNNGIDDDANGYVDDVNGWNAYGSNGNIPVDGHGTAVNGIVGATGNNNLGVAGVNWDVKIMTIAGSSGNEATVIEAYSYLLESRMLYNSSGGTEGSFVVATNASFGIDFGNPDNYPIWCGMYDTLGENGILSCGATINGNQNVDVIGDVPTACPSEYLISVTNTNINDVKVTNAGYGLETIDLGAPGAGAYTTSTSGYGGFGGTSGATPHVTGTIALLYSAPCANLSDLALSDPSRAARLVRDFIFSGVDPNQSLEGITVTGGRLNVNTSLQKLLLNCESLASENFDNSIEFVELYPNPANEYLKINYPENETIELVSIYTIDGKLVQQEETFSSNSINVNSLSKGLYVVMLKFKGKDTKINKQLIKI
jgi:subtilisin family serine protease